MKEFFPIQRPKIGFFIEQFENSELCFSILYKNMYQNKELPEIDTFVFYKRPAKPPISHLCCSMFYQEAYTFDGPIIATSLDTALKLIAFPTPCPKCFFIDDLEWIRFSQKQYDILSAIYQNPELHLITRSQDHRIMVETAWNKKVSFVLENYEFFQPEFTKFLFDKTKPIYENSSSLLNKPLSFKNSINV